MKARALLMILSLIVVGLFAASPASAGDVTAEFNAANKLYAEGKFADAAAVYEKTIQETLAGHSVSAALYFNDGNAEFKLGHLGRAIAAYRHAALLTPRELEVLAALAEGMTNKAIARRLDISLHTVKFHVESLFRKLGARTRTEAVAKASERRRHETITL